MERWLILLFRGCYLFWAGPLLVQWLGATDPAFALPRGPAVAQMLVAIGGSFCVIGVGLFRPAFVRRLVLLNDGAVFALFLMLASWDAYEWLAYDMGRYSLANDQLWTPVVDATAAATFLMLPSLPLLAEGGIAWVLWKGMPLLLRRYR